MSPRAKSTPAAMRSIRLAPPPEDAPPPYTNVNAHKSLSASLDEFEQQIGGRQILRDTLVMGESLDPSLKRLLEYLSSQQLARQPLFALCQKAGVTPGDFFAALKPAMLARAQVMMLHRVARSGPDVVEAIVGQAVDREAPCSKCEGDGTIDNAKRCPKCKGTGIQKVRGKLAQQKLVLELVGFMKKSGGLTILQQNSNAATAQQAAVAGKTGGALDALQQAVTDLLYGKSAKEAPLELPALDAVAVQDLSAPPDVSEPLDTRGVSDVQPAQE